MVTYFTTADRKNEIEKYVADAVASGKELFEVNRENIESRLLEFSAKHLSTPDSAKGILMVVYRTGGLERSAKIIINDFIEKRRMSGLAIAIECEEEALITTIGDEKQLVIGPWSYWDHHA